MSNPPKQKGTAGENEILQDLHDQGLTQAHRTEAARESHDIWLDDIPVEVKFRRRWDLFKWIRGIRKISDTDRWAIFAIHGDRRTTAGAEVGKVMVVDGVFGAELLALWLGKGD